MKFDNSFLYHKIKRHLRETIIAKAEDGQEVRLKSERDMAADMNVSRFSVNKAISELVAEGYLLKRRGVGVYIPPREQLTALMQHGNTVAIIVPDSSVYYYGDIYKEFETIAFERNYKIMLSLIGDDPGKEQNILSGLQGQAVKGVIAAPHLSGRNGALYKQLYMAGIPVVLIARIHESLASLPHVIYDQGEGSFQAGRLLLGQGRSRLLYIGDFPDSYLSHLRRNGLERAVAEGGGEMLELFSNKAPDFDDRLLNSIREHRVDGIVAFNDLIAIRAMNVLIKHGVRVPDEVGIVGYDNSLHADFALVPLTSVKFDKTQLARTAFATLIDLIEGREAAVEQTIGTELVLRESSGNVGGAACESIDEPASTAARK